MRTARAAQLIFLVQPIRLLFSGVVILAAVFTALTLSSLSAYGAKSLVRHGVFGKRLFSLAESVL